MLIPFSNPIWSRLYGPYGVQDVAGILANLRNSWDAEIAKDLLWEKFHHQEDLYPVTFAAFPWLWEISGTVSSRNTDVLDFFSFTMKCARSSTEGYDAVGTGSKFRGLSLQLSDHQHSWIPEHSRMTGGDMETLASLETWYSGNCGIIADTCIEAIDDSNDYLAAMLSLGYASLHGGDTGADLIIAWADQIEAHKMHEMLENYPLQSADVSALSDLSKMISSKNKRLARFLEETTSPYLQCQRTESFL